MYNNYQIVAFNNYMIQCGEESVFDSLKIASDKFPRSNSSYIAIKHVCSTLSRIFLCAYRVAILVLLPEQSIHRTRKQKVLYGNYGATNYSVHGDVSALTMNASH